MREQRSSGPLSFSDAPLALDAPDSSKEGAKFTSSPPRVVVVVRYHASGLLLLLLLFDAPLAVYSLLRVGRGLEDLRVGRAEVTSADPQHRSHPGPVVRLVNKTLKTLKH